MRFLHWIFQLGVWYATSGSHHVGPFYTRAGAQNEASLWNETAMQLGSKPVWYVETRKRLK